MSSKSCEHRDDTWHVEARYFGPMLNLKLRATKGNLTRRQNGTQVIYFHIEVRNTRRRNPAKNVRVKLVGIDKKRPNGDFTTEPLAHPLQLCWVFPDPVPSALTITSFEHCDLGYLNADAAQFTLASYVFPNRFVADGGEPAMSHH